MGTTHPHRDRMIVLAVVLTTVALGCADATTPEIVVGQVPSEDALAPPAASLDDALGQLPDLARSLLEKTGVPGVAVAVVHSGETVFAEGFGVKTLGTDDAVDAETVFQIASVSKSIGATVVATQVAKGTVDWTTPVHELLPAFRLSDPYVSEHVTIGDLYSHRSGLPHGAGDDLEDIGYDRDYVLAHLVYEPLDPFRQNYNYSNFGMTTGAQAVSAAAGVSWEDLAERELFEPLGMTSTSARYEDFLRRDNRATLHAKVGDSFQALYQRNANAQSPAGGVSSNVVDLAKWMELVLADGATERGQLIDAAALTPAITAEMITGQQAPAQRPGHYGFGFGVNVQPSGRVSLNHSGAFVLGAATNYQMLPESDVGIVVLTNAGPIGAAEALAAQFLDLVQYDTITRDWLADFALATAGYHTPAGDLVGVAPPSTPAPARPLEQYTGQFANPYFGVATVRIVNDHLVVQLGPGTYRLTLDHWDGDTFSFVPHGENAPHGSVSSATFEIDGDGADILTLQFFDTHGLGSWTR